MKKPLTETPTAITTTTETDLELEQKISSMSDEEVQALNAYNPVVRAVMSGQQFSKNTTGTDLELFASITTLGKQIKEVKDGDLSCAEMTLAAQANTLDLIFNSLVGKASNSEQLTQFETYMRMALKAQNQCRTTYEALAEIKNPKPMAFIKQQNVGLNQQINNDAAPLTHEKSVNSSNELLEENQHGQWLDTRTTGTTIRTDQELEAVGVIDRSKNA
jgi:hypothetical protein